MTNAETDNNQNEEANTENNPWQNMGEQVPFYKKIDNVVEYAKQLEASGVEAITAEKFARIAARKGQAGEHVTSWSANQDGSPVIENEAEVVADEQSGETGWVATKMNENGEPVVDKNGHTNEWIIPDATFRKKYEDDPEHPGVFKPKGGPQKFVKVSEAIKINQWGGEMNVDAGGYINVTNPDDMYIISGRDFADTYKEKKAEQSAPDAGNQEATGGNN